MLFGEILRVAVGALTANKLRSLLTMLGIVIGIGAVITMVALGNGAQRQVTDRIAALGTTLIRVEANRRRWGGVGSADIEPLTLEDVQAIRERAKHIVAIQPQQDVSMNVQYGSANIRVQITGTSPNYLTVRNYELAAGRMFNTVHDRLAQRVAVLGWTALEQLGLMDPNAIVGDYIRINGMRFRVVGVMDLKGQVGGRANEQILIPIHTARYRLFGRERLNDIFALARDEASIPMAMAELQTAIRRSHELKPGDEDDFRIRLQADFLETLNESAQTFTMLLAGIAGVSLLVGGIGIMNIMLVSVVERTHEIGVRKAIGATKANILVQFLAEAVIICIVGGALGVAAGIGGARLLADTFSWAVHVDPQTIALAVGYAGAIGLVFGVWPARRAARMDPIDALRYEH